MKLKAFFPISLLIAIILIFVSPLSQQRTPSAQAAPLKNTFTVCSSGCNYTTIQEAINNASPGDLIQLSNETYTEAITVDKSLTIQGTGSTQTIIQAAPSLESSSSRVFSIQSGVTVTITHVTIRYGKANGAYGGGINSLGSLVLNQVSLTHNSAGRGGGLYCGAGTCQINQTTISDNEGNFFGGGLYISNSTADITNSTIENNHAQNNGGGIYIDDPICVKTNRLNISSSTISGNTAKYGGGVYLTCGTSTATFTNVTISGNQGTDYGGGIANTWEATSNIYNSTISNNSSSDGGGLKNRDNGTINLFSSIVANSTSGGDCSNAATINDNGYNLVEDGSCISHSTSISGDPELSPLADNGGSSKTHALSPTSPAIDAGSCATSSITEDQRGQSRQDWQCDIGSFELQLADDNSITKSVAEGKVYTFGPTMAKVEVVDDGNCLTEIQITRFQENHPNATSALQTGQYWTITPQGCNQGFSVKLSLPHNSTPDANDKICRYTGSGQIWNCTSDGFETVHNTISNNNVTQFSDWTTGENATPNAIKVSNLQARQQHLPFLSWGLLLTGLISMGYLSFIANSRSRNQNNQ